MKITYREERHADLPHVVKASGGKSSGMMLLKLLEARTLKPERGDIAVFNNTSAEHRLTYEFVRGFRQRVTDYGLPFFLTEYQSYERMYRKRHLRTQSFRLCQPEHLLQDGSVYEELTSYNIGFMPTVHRRTCTRWLKVKPTIWLVEEWLAGKKGLEKLGSDKRKLTLDERYDIHQRHGGKLSKEDLQARVSFVLDRQVFRPSASFAEYGGTGEALNQNIVGDGEFVTLIGLRADEPRRVERVTCSTRNPGEHSYTPLSQSGVTQAEVVKWWQEQPKPHPAPSHLNNCTFCFLKGKSILEKARKDDPDSFKWWTRMEATYGSFLGAGNPPLFSDNSVNDCQMELSLPCECVD